MMGGEFCGNAARSFGLFAARCAALAGKHRIPIEISGVKGPLMTHIDTGTSAAWVEIPPPVAEETVEIKGRRFPLYVFEGISHVIAEDIECDEALVHSLARECDCGALGVMFYDSGKRFMRPVVWVRETGTTVFESSCGSGTAALGVWETRNVRDGRKKIVLAQPGGLIETELEKKDGRVMGLSIGGKVGLGEPFTICT
jgi:diaminopimelate epimerase